MEGEGLAVGVDFAFEVLFGLGDGEALAAVLFLAVGEGDGLAFGASFSAATFAAVNLTHSCASLLAAFAQKSFANSTLLAISTACASVCMAAFSARAFSVAASIQL